ncbi:MAG: signal peptide peptidase SppA [Bacteroidota bacterium]|nr:signal peptide peptidase SppA [Bacteroidota bacterium]
MWKFIKQVFATFFAIIIAIFFLILIGVGIAASTSSKQGIVEIKDNSVLHLQLNKRILEKEEENPFEGLDIPFTSDRGGMGLIELVKAIKYAKTDSKIKGIYLELSAIPAGYAMVEEIRAALLDFKESGKFIYSYSESYFENGYYLASVADKILLNPSGLLEFNGIQYKYTFFKGALQKLEIEPQVFRVGEYKSAVEPFLLDKMSDANRKQSLSFISSINNYHLEQIGLSRDIPFKKIKNISDSMLVHNANDAVKYDLVTDLVYYDQVLELLRKALKLDEKTKPELVSYNKYKSTIKEPTNNSKNIVAVLVAEGDINTGKSEDGTIGSDNLSEEIRKLRLDDNVKSVVLRINSPGGSALASDIMWREIVLLAEKKPIVASMSDVAASGGYYIAMGCTKIVADKNSITGSIGVFGLIFNIKDFLKNKLGITTDGVQTGLFSDIGTMSRPLTTFERKVIQQEVDNIYKDFVEKAAKGRNMTVDSLKKLASGRVWSGIEAQNNGLVDELGGLGMAIELAAKSAKIDTSYKIEYRPASKNVIEKFIEDFQNESKMKTLQSELGENLNIYMTAKKIQKMVGIQARMPFGSELE